MKGNLLTVLVNLGLDEKEAKIYLALVELDQASVLKISRKSKVNRASIYYILEKMKRKGLVSHIEKGGTDYFVATKPDLLFAQQESKVKDLKAALPEMKGLVNETGAKPRVLFYEGIEGVKAIYADSLNAKTEILDYANSQEVRDHWPEYDIEYVAKRVAKKIFLRGLAPDDDYGREVQADDKKSFRDIRLINPQLMNMRDEIKIYDNKVAMVSFADAVFGVIIESEAMANTQRSIFEMAWLFASKKSP